MKSILTKKKKKKLKSIHSPLPQLISRFSELQVTLSLLKQRVHAITGPRDRNLTNNKPSPQQMIAGLIDESNKQLNTHRILGEEIERSRESKRNHRLVQVLCTVLQIVNVRECVIPSQIPTHTQNHKPLTIWRIYKTLRREGEEN